MQLTAPKPCRVSVVIKALNEEKRIAKAIETALAAVATIGGEVILADSCSSDKTVEIASRYPITITQLANPQERCCGIGPQLGFQESSGEFVYILDGDMEMLDGFLEQAVAYMETHPDVGGVGGLVVEKNTDSMEYKARMERASGHMQPGPVDRLDMGGLYRRTAIEQVGYFSNRNLHAYEEYDLGVRMRSKGWRLIRLAANSVNHYGHDAPAYQLLLRRWKTGYICGLGEVIRAAAGKPHFSFVLGEVRELRIYVMTLVWWLAILGIALWPLPIFTKLLSLTLVLASFPVAMTIRKRSLAKGLFSVVSWCFNAGGLVRGTFSKQKSPEKAIESIRIKTATHQEIAA